MNHFKYLCLVLALLLPLSVEARGHVWRKAVTILKGKAPVPASAVRKTVPLRPEALLQGDYLSLSLQKSMQRTFSPHIHFTQGYNFELVQQNIRQAMVEKTSFQHGQTTSSGVIFRAVENGQEKLWVALSHHATSQGKGEVLLTFTLLNGSKTTVKLPIAIYGEAGPSGADAALVELPLELYNKVFALQWAKESPKVGEVLESYGFEVGRINLKKVSGRVMKATSEYQMITTKEDGRPGSCGGPVINGAGYMVGIHCGAGLGEGFAVNRHSINDLLKAYYTGHAYRPVKYFDKELGFVEIREIITDIYVMRGDKFYTKFSIGGYHRPFHYSKIQELMEFQPGDKIQIWVASPQKEQRIIFYTVE